MLMETIGSQFGSLFIYIKRKPCEGRGRAKGFRDNPAGEPLALPWASAQSPQGGVAEHTKAPQLYLLQSIARCLSHFVENFISRIE